VWGYGRAIIPETPVLPRYFFNLEGPPLANNPEGTLVDGPEQARSDAVSLVGEMLKDMNGKFWDAPAWRLYVTNEQGATVCVLTIRGVKDEF
jgi:hypothetical protein